MKKNAYIMIFPVIIVLLMIIIFIFDKRTKQAGESEATSGTETVAETTAALTMVMKLADFDTYGLQEDAVPEVKSIITEYQNAKLHADAAKMLELYGRTVEDENLTAGLVNDKRLYQRFEDTKTYVTAGVTDNSYLVFVTSKIKFHFVETPAPSLTWTYVQKGDDGKMILKDPYNLTPEETAFVNKVASSDAVKAMSDQIKKELAAAVISDAQLANIYKTLSGSSVTSDQAMSEGTATEETTETESDAQISIIGETSAAAQPSAGEETSAADGADPAETTSAGDTTDADPSEESNAEAGTTAQTGTDAKTDERQ